MHRQSAIFSALFHFAVIAIAFFGLPQFRQPQPVVAPPIAIEVVTVADVTNPPKGRKDVPEEKKPEAEKPETRKTPAPAETPKPVEKVPEKPKEPETPPEPVFDVMSSPSVFHTRSRVCAPWTEMPAVCPVSEPPTSGRAVTAPGTSSTATLGMRPTGIPSSSS